MPAFNVAPGDATVAPRNKVYYADVIDQMMKDLANRRETQNTVDEERLVESGRRLSTNDVRTPRGTGAAIREGIRALGTAYEMANRTTPGVQPTMLANPRHPLWAMAAKIAPEGVLRYLKERPDVIYKAKISKGGPGGLTETSEWNVPGLTKLLNTAAARTKPAKYMSADELKEWKWYRSQEPNTRRAAVPVEAEVSVRQDVWRRLNNPKELERLRQDDPDYYRDLVTTLQHELMHGVNVGPGRKKAAQQMPFKNATSVKEAATPGEQRWLDMLMGRTEQNTIPPRVAPAHLSDFAMNYASRGPGVVGREGLVQRAAENQARQMGLLTPKEYVPMPALTPKQIQDLQWQLDAVLGTGTSRGR